MSPAPLGLLPTRDALAATGMCFGYGEHDVLHDLAAHFPPGSVTAVAGPNGSGKSTLLELLAGTLHPRRGRIERPAGNRTTALVVQRPQVSDQLPVTVRDVVRMGTWRNRVRRREAGERIDRALETLGIAELADRRLGELSGGQRQRAFVALGMVQAAGTVLLDEPATGLDADSRAMVRRALSAEAARGATVVCVTHDRDLVDTAHHVVRLGTA